MSCFQHRPSVRPALWFALALGLFTGIGVPSRASVYVANCCTAGGSISLIDNGKELQNPGIPVTGSANIVAVSANGKTLFGATKSPARLLSIDIATRATQYQANLAGSPLAMAASADGSTLFVGTCATTDDNDCPQSSVAVFNSADLSSVTTLNMPPGKLAGLALDPAGSNLYATIAPGKEGGQQGFAQMDVRNLVVTGFVPVSKTVLGSLTVLPDGTEAMSADLLFPAIRRIDLTTGVIIATIPLRSRATAIALSPDSQTLYSVGEDLTAIDTNTNAMLFRTYITPTTSGLAVSPDGSRCYIGDSFLSTLDTFDFGAGQVTARVPTGFRPRTVAVSPDGSITFVASAGSSTVSRINEQTNAVTAVAEAGSEPSGIQISPDGKYVYAINSYSSNVSVLNTYPFARITDIQTGYLPLTSVLSPDGSRLYVSNYDATITVVDTHLFRVVHTIQTAPAGSSAAFGVALSSSGKYLYALTEYNTFQGILVIDTQNFAVVKMIPVAGDISQIAIGPLDAIAYIAGDSEQPFLLVVDLIAGKQIDSIPVPKPYGVAIAPRGKYIYTGTTNDAAISVINRETGTVVSHMAVEGNVAFALNPQGTKLYATGPVVTVFDTATRAVLTTVDTGGPSLGVAAQ